MAGEWWEEKWYWTLCVLLPLLIALFAPGVFGVSKTEALIRAVPLSVAVVFAYYVRSQGSLHLYRLIAIGGGVSVGFFVTLSLFPILDLNLRPGLGWLLLLTGMILGGIVSDKVMERRNYRPFV